MMWFWLNVPLMVTFFAAMSGIPLYMVLRNPSWGPQRTTARRTQVHTPTLAGAPALVGA